MDFMDDYDIDQMFNEGELKIEPSQHQPLTNTKFKKVEIQRNQDNNILETPKPEHLEVLLRCFGHKEFRPMQWQIISSIIHEQRDNCAIMTTGYGKSLCYQFPSTFKGGTTLIISPLISLMEDQVLAMKVANISACLLGTANENQAETLEDIFNNKYLLVYLTPEFCTGERGQDLLKSMYKQLSITLIAVDEAHCVSSWGHDFRFKYRELGILKLLMPTVPILAVTATATQKVREDIISVLNLRNPQLLCSGINRPNLYFSVFKKGSYKTNDLEKLMQKAENGRLKFPGATIIYCISRKDTEEISKLLNSMGINSLPYHAGLPLKIRKTTHEKFVKDQVDVIVATIAFGMGIDKPDIRNIIHYGSSSSIEAYYQEVGRAGRDGLPAKCTSFYSNGDFSIQILLMEKGGNKEKKEQMLDIMKEYLSLGTCRRRFIIEHFEEKDISLPNQAVCCDNCSRNLCNNQYEGLDSNGLYDFTEDFQKFLGAVKAMNGAFGIINYVLFIRGSRNSKIRNFCNHPLHGCGKEKSESWWKGVAFLLEQQRLLVKSRKSAGTYIYCTFGVSEKGDIFLSDAKRKFLGRPTHEQFQCLKPKTSTWIKCNTNTQNAFPQPSTSSRSQVLTQTYDQSGEDLNFYKEDDLALYKLLLEERFRLAKEFNCMPWTVASERALIQMAKNKPVSATEFKNCRLDGFTENKLVQFGLKFVDLIRTDLGLNSKTKSSETEEINKDRNNSIEEILVMHPFSKSLMPSAQVTYASYKSGLIPEVISKQRKISLSTIYDHLIEAMKMGFPLKLSVFGVTKNIKKAVMDAVNSVETGLEFLTPLKRACPENVTFLHIKAVVAYVKIRNHLKNLKVPYEEFDDDFEDSHESKTEVKTVEKTETKNENKSTEENLDEFLKEIADCMENWTEEIDEEFFDQTKVKEEPKQNFLKEKSVKGKHLLKSKIKVESVESDDENSKTPSDNDLITICENVEASLTDYDSDATFILSPKRKKDDFEDFSDSSPSKKVKDEVFYNAAGLDSPPRRTTAKVSVNKLNFESK